VITVSNIKKTFDSVIACSDITFEVKPGELFGLIGPDGAGKTTLFRILTTLILPDSGTALLDGHDVVKGYKTIRTIIGYMPGRFSLYQDLSVEENLEFYATVFGTTIQKNYHLIKDIYTHIEPFKKRLAGRLSGGMKQKLALCCALIHSPKILVLDEPTTGVDAVSRTEFWHMLRKLRKNGITIIVSTPYMDEAGLCDRVALIQNGVVFTIDAPHSIIANFRKCLYAVKGKSKYRLIKDLRASPVIDSAHVFGDAIHITFADDKPEINLVESYLKENGHEGFSISEIPATIEDYFLQWSLAETT